MAAIPPADVASSDEVWMQEALREARLAAASGDVPVGAVLVIEGVLVARGRNRRELDQDPCAHAEVVVLREAARTLGHWRLADATVYVTLEPCAMCAGALVSARIRRLVYGCADPKAGAVDSLFRIGQDARLNHRFQVDAPLLQDACAEVLREFFRARRSR